MKAHISFFIFLIIFILPGVGQAQLLSVSGYVNNNMTGEAIKNATIFEAFSGIGTITNHDGYYRLLLNPGQQSLKISTTGFDAYTSKFNLAADTVISVNMKPQNMSDNNVVAGNKLKKDSIKPQKNRNQFENENK